MTKAEIKKAILDILNAVQGDGYITAGEIYRRSSQHVHEGHTQEPIRSYIRELIHEGSLLGSSKNGFFIIRTQPQLEEAINYLNYRIRPCRQEMINSTVLGMSSIVS